MAAVQRIAVQRRAVEIGTAIGTKSHFKIAPISWREARPLQRLVRPQVEMASLNLRQSHSALQLLRLIPRVQSLPIGY